MIGDHQKGFLLVPCIPLIVQGGKCIIGDWSQSWWNCLYIHSCSQLPKNYIYNYGYTWVKYYMFLTFLVLEIYCQLGMLDMLINGTRLGFHIYSTSCTPRCACSEHVVLTYHKFPLFPVVLNYSYYSNGVSQGQFLCGLILVLYRQ